MRVFIVFNANLFKPDIYPRKSFYDILNGIHEYEVGVNSFIDNDGIGRYKERKMYSARQKGKDTLSQRIPFNMSASRQLVYAVSVCTIMITG